MSDIRFQGFWRMDWGLGNPNKTAALIATLLVAVWAIAYLRKWGFWVALAPFVGLGICLIHTYSRGGLIAAFAGCGVLLLAAPRPWPMRRVIATGVAVAVMVAASVYLQAHERYGQGVASEDRSITNRLDLWKYAPAMMVGAPGGWGWGKSGEAFMQWYQPVDRFEEYRTLVSSHLTWLVEFGWGWRFLYVLGWLAVLLLCWPDGKARWRAVSLGVWVCFGVASVFSSVAESGWLWIAPGVMLLACVIARVARRDFPPGRAWVRCASAAMGICALFWVAGWQRSPVHKRSDLVVIGPGAPEVWVLADAQVIGKTYGKTLRKFLEAGDGAGKTIGIATNARAVAGTKDCVLVVTGSRTAEELESLTAKANEASKVVLLSPRFFPQEFAVKAAKLDTSFGEFSQSPTASAWEQAGNARRLPGVGDYFPAWPENVLSTP